MKYLVRPLTIVVIAIITACGGTPKSDSYTYVEFPDSIINAPYVNTFIKDLDSGLIGKRILLRGRITNVRQGNRHCIMSNSDKSIRLDAKGDIMGFNKELIGNEMTVYGTLCEKRFYKDDLLRMRRSYMELLEAASADTSITTECERIASDLTDVNMMYQWTIDNNLPYYSIMSIDAEEYTILN
ncbi:MAG: hypothetical protein MJZ18_05365 [Bacteroidales bacterium]|nr:hypothetical protein [Bacteroidales bacterium]